MCWYFLLFCHLEITLVSYKLSSVKNLLTPGVVVQFEVVEGIPRAFQQWLKWFLVDSSCCPWGELIRGLLLPSLVATSKLRFTEVVGHHEQSKPGTLLRSASLNLHAIEKASGLLPQWPLAGLLSMECPNPRWCKFNLLCLLTRPGYKPLQVHVKGIRASVNAWRLLIPFWWKHRFLCTIKVKETVTS